MENNDNDYDFKMEWPEEFAEYANLPPLSDEALNGIIAAITPVMRQIRIKRRINSAIKAGTTMMSVGICVLTAVTLINRHAQIEIPATEMVKQIMVVPPENIEPIKSETNISSPAAGKQHSRVRLTATVALQSNEHTDEPGKNEFVHRAVEHNISGKNELVNLAGEHNANAGASHPDYGSQETPGIGSAEEVTGSRKQEWTATVGTTNKRLTNPELIPEGSAGGADKAMPK